MENKFLRDFLARQAKDAIIESTVSEPVVKGKTKKMGVSSMDMKKMGRNLARVANQKKAGRGR